MRTVQLDEVGEVELRKSSRAKRLILKIDQSGKPIVTMPVYVPYHIAANFARNHRAWLLEHLPKDQNFKIYDGMPIGKTHIIKFVASNTHSKPSAQVRGERVTISYPESMQSTDASVQAEASKGAARALRRQAEQQLPALLHQLARQHGYSYREIRIKAVRTRWGSCSSGKIINLSIWLMQLPEPLIEYVLCHELAHLEHLNHSQSFWQAVEAMVPDYRARRKELKQYSPRLMQA